MRDLSQDQELHMISSLLQKRLPEVCVTPTTYKIQPESSFSEESIQPPLKDPENKTDLEEEEQKSELDKAFIADSSVETI